VNLCAWGWLQVVVEVELLQLLQYERFYMTSVPCVCLYIIFSIVCRNYTVLYSVTG